MAVSCKLYGLAIQSLFNKEIDWDTDTVKCVLVKATYTPNQDTHRYKSDLGLGANEVANGGGYTTGGMTVTGKTVTYDAATNTLKLDCDDVDWGATTTIVDARYAVFFVETAGADTTDPLICYWDFGQTVSTLNGPFKLTIAAAGLVTATAAA